MNLKNDSCWSWLQWDILKSISIIVNMCNLQPTLIYSGTLRVWELDRDNRKIRPTDVTMGQLKRVVKCIQVWFQKLLSCNMIYCSDMINYITWLSDKRCDIFLISDGWQLSRAILFLWNNNWWYYRSQHEHQIFPIPGTREGEVPKWSDLSVPDQIRTVTSGLRRRRGGSCSVL